MNPAELELKVERAVKLLAEVHGAKLSEPRKNRYVRKLSRFGDVPAMWRVLDKACDDDRMPNPQNLCAAVVEEQSRSKPTTIAPSALTGEAKHRADKAMIRSMIWLHLVKGWPPERFTGMGLARLFQRQERNPGDFLRAAILHENWTAESIDEWMRTALLKADRDEERAREEAGHG